MTASIAQITSVQGGSVTSLAPTWPAATTAGNTLIAIVVLTVGRTVTAPSGWSQRTSDTGSYIHVFEIVGSATRSGTETFTFASASAGVWLFEASGIDTTTPYDTTLYTTGAPANEVIAGPLTTGPESGIVFAVGTSHGGTLKSQSPSPTGTWTDEGSLSNGGGRAAVAFPTTGSVTLSCDFGATAQNWTAGLVSYNVTGQTGAALSASAGANQQVKAGATVTLSGAASGGTGPYVYAWTQTGGTTVILSSTSTQSPTFTAPADVNPSTLTFSLTVTDSTSATASATTTVTVAAGPYMYRRESGAWVKRKLYRRASGSWQWP